MPVSPGGTDRCERRSRLTMIAAQQWFIGPRGVHGLPDIRITEQARVARRRGAEVVEAKEQSESRLVVIRYDALRASTEVDENGAGT